MSVSVSFAKGGAVARVLVSSLAIGLVPGAFAAEPAPQARPAAMSTTASASGPVVVIGATGATLPSLADIVERVTPAVVSLTTPKGLGSGFVVDSSGYVVTNNHVIADATEVDVRFGDGAKFKAKLVGRDAETDIALLKIDTGKSMPSVRFEDDKRVRVGDWVLAVGNPFGLGGTVTAGIISARGRDQIGSAQFTDYLQVDAAINPGNSGGPTFDMSGRVIGMNTIAVSSRAGSGIGFAIPSSTIQRVIEDLKTSGTVSRGFVGVQIASLTEDSAQALGLPNANGALVTDVIPGSPAEAGGFKAGDVVLKMNGQGIKDNRDLSRKIAALQVGQSATFTVWRNGAQVTLTVTAKKRDLTASNEQPLIRMTSLGIGLQTVTAEVRNQLAFAENVSGVMITEVDPMSDAAVRGLRAGDRIVAVGGEEVKSLGDVNLAVEQAKALKRGMVLLFVATPTGGKTPVPVKIGQQPSAP
jgi:serine protease Do